MAKQKNKNVLIHFFFLTFLTICSTFLLPHVSQALQLVPSTWVLEKDTALANSKAESVAYHAQRIWSRELLLVFDEPMIEAPMIGDISADNAPFTVSPALKFSGRWVDTRTLSLSFIDNFPATTKITVTPKAGFASVKKTPVTKSYSFIPFPLLVDSLYQVAYKKDGTSLYRIVFDNDVVTAEDVQRHLKVYDDKKNIISGVQVTKEGNSTSSFLISLTAPLNQKIHFFIPKELKSAKASLGLYKDYSSFETPSSMLAINNVRGRYMSRAPWSKVIEINTTGYIRPEVLKKFLQVEGVDNIYVEAKEATRFWVKGDFGNVDQLRITIQKGIPRIDGKGLIVDNYDETIFFDKRQPALALGEQGTLASPASSLLVPINSINVTKIGFTLREVQEASVSLIGTNAYGSYRSELAPVIATSTSTLESSENTILEQSVNVADLAKGKKGVFILMAEDISDYEDWSQSYLSDYEQDSNRSRISGRTTEQNNYGYDGDYYDNYDEDDYYSSSKDKSQKVVIVSDIGLIARVSPTGLTVWANSLATATPMAGVTLKVYTSSNILLAEGKTDTSGLWRFISSAGWNSQAYPFILVASTPAKPLTKAQLKTQADNAGKKFEPLRKFDDLTYLQFTKDLFSSSQFNTGTGGNSYLASGYEALAFTPRDVFRPGETVPIRGIVRDNLMKAPKPFPVEWKVYTPTGRTAGQGFVTLTEAGLLECELGLVPSAPTGRYNIEFAVPAQGVIGRHSFTVEELQPPRLDVSLAPQKPFVLQNEEFALDVGAMYLFGAPAAGVRYEAELKLYPSSFTPAAWKDYTFAYGATDRSIEDVTLDGTLDEKGNATFKTTIASPKLAGAYNVRAAVKVAEDGGRFVTKVISVPFFAEPVQFGFKEPAQSYLVNTPSDLEVCAISPDSTGLNGTFTYSISKERNFYYWVDADYSSDAEYIPLEKGDATFTDGKANIRFTAQEKGRYVMLLQDQAGTTKRPITFDVYPNIVGSDNSASPVSDKVFLEWDKKTYDVGDIAKLHITAPFAGRMLLTVETDKEKIVKVIENNTPETFFSIPVSEDMAPNAYVSVVVIRPMEKDVKWQVGRAVGLIPLKIEKTSAKLLVDITAPERVLPMSTVPVSVSLKNAQGKPVQGEVSISFVDEGLLAYTNYKTPNPFGFFSTKRILATLLYDRYDELIPFTDKKTLELTPGGGDDGYGDGGRLSVVLRKVELFTVAHEIVKTNAQGVATVSLAVPEYSGKGRIIAVAATKNASGSAHVSVQINRDITVEATAPRMVAPGDTFELPILAFADAKASGKAHIVVSTSGPLALNGSGEFAVDLTGQKRQSMMVPFVAQAEMGLAKIILTTTIEGDANGAFTQTIEVPVRPPFPLQTKKEVGAVLENTPVTINFPTGMYPGSEKLTVTFSETPEVALTSALEYLRSYPHGCLEQTTSSTWPYLAVPLLLKKVAPDMADNTTYKKALSYGVRRILAMQRPDGGFVMWPGDNLYRGDAYSWGSVYAIHLLTELHNTGSNLVPSDAIVASGRWMQRELSRELPPAKESYEWGVRAYIAYVMTLQGQPPLGWMAALKDNEEKLSTSGQIFLAGAYALAEGKSTALKELGTSAYETSSYGWSYESIVRNEALRLLMWAQVDPYAAETAVLAKRVLDAGAKDMWRTTQENALASLALGRYFEKIANEKNDFVATLSTAHDGNTSTLMEFATGDALPHLTNEQLLNNPQKQALPLTIAIAPRTQGKTAGILYYSMVAQGVPVAKPQATNNGITLLRSWHLPNGNVVNSFTKQANGKILPQEQAISVEQGDIIDVALHIRPNRYVNSIVLTDIVPGGFDIEAPTLISGEYDHDEDDANSAAMAPDVALKRELAVLKKVTVEPTWTTLLNSQHGVRADVRDDRIILYADYVSQGSVFVYRLRAVSKGTFIIPPAQVEGMYETDINALSATGTVTVTPAVEKDK